MQFALRLPHLIQVVLKSEPFKTKTTKLGPHQPWHLIWPPFQEHLQLRVVVEKEEEEEEEEEEEAEEERRRIWKIRLQLNHLVKAALAVL